MTIFFYKPGDEKTTKDMGGAKFTLYCSRINET